MKQFATILGPEFVVKTDYYPYTQSKKIISQLGHWWEHDSRKDDVRKDNYSLDPSLPNSVGNSFERKLVDGNFSFIYHKKEIFSFVGFQVVGDSAWCHRFTNNPNNYFSNTGASTSAFLPLHIKWAREKNLEFYKLSFNEHNYRIYQFLKKGWHIDGPRRGPSLANFDWGMRLMHKFEFVGQQVVNYTDQWVLSLDLSRPDIDDFILL
jgi:hypothetical protein